MSYVLDPSAVLDFEVDWTPWLAQGETITSHAITATDGVTIDSHSESGGKVTVWLSHGVIGAAATITCHVTTSAGRQDDRSFPVQVSYR